MMDVDDDSILLICGALRIQDLFNLSSCSTRLKSLAERELEIQTKLLIYKKSPVTDWSDTIKKRGETGIHKSDPLDSIVLDASKKTKDFAKLLNKLPNLQKVTFGVYTTFTKGVVEVINGKLLLVTSMSFYFPFGLHGKRLAQLNMENLTHLRVRYAGLTEPDLKIIVSKCSKLDFLDVTGNWYISGHCFRLSNLRLKTLQISRCSGFTYDGLEATVEGAGRLLESLEIDFLGSADKVEPEFHLICSSLINLRSLRFRSSSFSGRDSSYVRWLKNLTSLTIIEVGPMMTDDSLITIMSSCSGITHLHLDLCYSRALLTAKSIKLIPKLLPILANLKMRHVKTLDEDTFHDFGNLQKILVERCGTIPLKVLSNFAHDVNLIVDPCSDVSKFFEDSLQVAIENPKKTYALKVMSVEEFQVKVELPRNFRFNFCRKYE